MQARPFALVRLERRHAKHPLEPRDRHRGSVLAQASDVVDATTVEQEAAAIATSLGI